MVQLLQKEKCWHGSMYFFLFVFLVVALKRVVLLLVLKRAVGSISPEKGCLGLRRSVGQLKTVVEEVLKCHFDENYLLMVLKSL